MKDALMLAVALGSVLHQPGQQPVTLRGVPDDAQEQWEKGAGWLVLKKDSAAALATYSQYKLEELLKVRKAVGYAAEIEQLEKALKEKAKTDKKALPEKEK